MISVKRSEAGDMARVSDRPCQVIECEHFAVFVCVRRDPSNELKDSDRAAILANIAAILDSFELLACVPERGIK